MANWLDGLRSKVLGASAPGVYLGAFGKHPGWDDHIEPIGLSSDVLLAARDILYVGGIGGVINAALWEKKAEEVLPQIAHVFCWNSETDTVLGRMWSSVDGKGRSHYPMVAVAHLGVPFSYSLAARTAPVLAKVEAGCRRASTAEEVRGIFAAGLEELRAALAQPPDGLGPEPDRAVCSRVAGAMHLHEGETFARNLYALEGRMHAFKHSPKSGSMSKIGLKMLETETPAQQTRLPASVDDSIDSIAFWQKIVANYNPRRLPLLYLHPVGYGWLDLIIGTPTPKQLYCIRANEAGLPLASAVPYEIEPVFRQVAAEELAKMCDVTATQTSWAAEPALAMPPPLPPSA